MPQSMQRDTTVRGCSATSPDSASEYVSRGWTFQSGPLLDMRRAAWVNTNAFSTAWVTVWPSQGCRLSNAEFSEVAARYYGLPSPACRALCGQPTANTRTRLDAYGAALGSLPLPGDGWRRQHDEIKWRLDMDMREMGLRARTEVFGLFAALLPVAAGLRALDVPQTPGSRT